ncbi:Exodeoxyribonuclease VII small subunit [Caminicella sporogenes DSM 14501]|uniref:Exodeoxyribonuclease 7 small subunit n=1 Tax=Caminicella sporogenes DSM 14501 TaxID=1121266 RepID=A0A1M6LLN5_9FIRM|nr:exodeoxyribonuclease VII small subunit [Caminicella sporogenes]RKD27874.1 exodeoxyribonuclease VII small subunit [Caminicella sporogenes]SHJ72077.1 Exodeoxyribonuclease VII small subunit [Caminicella sporogenes DSM 14501]
MTDNTQNKSFETDLNRLKDIVKLLEEGNLSLEDSLKYFEEGIKIYRRCINVLNSAQQKISLLLHDEDGEIKTQPFDVYEEE